MPDPHEHSPPPAPVPSTPPSAAPDHAGTAGAPQSNHALPGAPIHPPAGSTSPPPPPSHRGTRRWLLPTITGAAGLLIGGAGTAAVMSGAAAADERAADEAASAVLGDAVDRCGVRDAVGFQLGDGGRSLTIDNKGEDDVVGADFVDIACVFGELGMPSSVSSHVGQTTSMDGRQSAEWENLEFQWSYHPDRGMDGVITVVEAS